MEQVKVAFTVPERKRIFDVLMGVKFIRTEDRKLNEALAKKVGRWIGEAEGNVRQQRTA